MGAATMSQERSRQRRDELLDAAIALFAEHGEPGITHRAVAARAGVPAATPRYYFGSIQALVEEALGRHIDAWVRDLQALTSVPVPGGLGHSGATDLVVAIFGVRSPEVVQTHLSVYLAATRSAALRPRAAEALTALEAMTARILVRLGVPEPEEVARCVVAAVAGSAFSRVSGRRTDREEAASLLRALRSLLAAAFLDEAELSDRLGRLRGPRPK